MYSTPARFAVIRYQAGRTGVCLGRRTFSGIACWGRGLAMSLPLSWRKWLRLPSRIALMLGVGALSAASAEAAVAEAHLDKRLMRVPQQSAKNFGELRIWTEGGRIYLSEGGRDAQEL